MGISPFSRLSVVEHYERTFEKFKQDTEQAIETCRREFNDIRKKFDELRRIRRSLVVQYVERGAPARHEQGGDSDGPPPPKRKRWGKKSSTRRRTHMWDWYSIGIRTIGGSFGWDGASYLRTWVSWTLFFVLPTYISRTRCISRFWANMLWRYIHCFCHNNISWSIW